MGERDQTLARIERRSLMVCAVLAAGSALLTGGAAAPAGVIGGGALVAISYRGIKAGIDAVEGMAGREGGRRVAVAGLVKFFTRYGILAAVAYVIMARLRLPPVAVLAGASSLVIAVMLEALRGTRFPDSRQH